MSYLITIMQDQDTERWQYYVYHPESGEEVAVGHCADREVAETVAKQKAQKDAGRRGYTFEYDPSGEMPTQ